MGMIIEKRPRVATGVCFRNQYRQPSDKVRPVIIGSKYPPTLDPPDDHMMQCPRRVYSCFSWYSGLVTYLLHVVKLKNIDVIY
jgi:hypothetical protein